MTDEQIQQSVAQAEQDATTLDYSKWSFQQRQQKLSTDHDLWKQTRDAVLDRRQRDNATARHNHLNKLENERKAEQSAMDAKIDLELAPTKKRLQNEWLANNPTQTAADFEKKAWHLLKENLIEQRSADIMNATIQSQAASGRYSL